ncbi:MAG: DUF1538 domain-containing protein [Deltaproteobacteria bacterium]|nr:DUF1538 domain-containing protein [Deltaproteobacteria bacterium]
MNMLIEIAQTFVATCRDVVPVLALIVGFQYIILRQPIPHLLRVIVGFGCVLIGLTLFLVGLEKALFPIGKIMAKQLSAPEFVFGTKTVPQGPDWWAYSWVYVFAALIGFATTIAEPALIAVAYKANQVSGGTISQWGLRLVVAFGVAIGIALGTFRIITGTPLFLYIAAGYLIVAVQTIFAPKTIIPLAYDSGGVTTSTVTVPLVAALGLGLSATIPGRNPALDGFGLIAFASLFPIMTVMAYAQVAQLWTGIRLKFFREG